MSWSDDHMLHLIGQLPDTTSSTVNKLNPTLYQYARIRFGSWSNAVIASGREVQKKYQSWSRERVLESLKQYYHNEMDLRAIAKVDSALYRAIKRYFTTNNAALREAGISRHLTIQENKEVEDRASSGLPTETPFPPEKERGRGGGGSNGLSQSREEPQPAEPGAGC